MKTKTKLVFRFVVVAITILGIQGCSKDDVPVPVNSDNITIRSVTPSIGLVGGQLVDFTVTINYHLYSNKTATLMLGFNNGSQFNDYRMLSSANKIVNQGSGVITFQVSAVVVKSWGSIGSFQAYANLSPDPLPSSWKPYAGSYYVLIP